MKNQFEHLRQAEYYDGLWHLELPNRAGVNVSLCEPFRTNLCVRVYEMYPNAPKAHIAKLVGCSDSVVGYRISKWKRQKQKRDEIALQKLKNAAPLTVATPEEEEALNAIAANATQVGGQHYKSKSIQPWDYIASNNLGYLEGNVVKYVSRWKDKGGVEDLKKAQHYLAKLIEVNE